MLVTQTCLFQAQAQAQAHTILTFRMGRFICFVPRHQVIKAAGFDPELLHSISYVFSAETNVRFAKIWTAAGFTVEKSQYQQLNPKPKSTEMLIV